jgi:von Willebrand factor type A domain
MNAIAFRATTALLTFLIGVGVAAAWVFNSKQPSIQPVLLTESPNANGVATLEMVFVLDTTGSMGGLLDGAKQRIWGIVNEVMQSESRPNVRIGLVAYRDRGDDYVTSVLPLTNDLDQVYTALMDYQAAGGGDTEEDVRQALLHGVRKAGWSPKSQHVSQILFLVGDAPPHQDYRDVPDTLLTTDEATRNGMIVNTIQCGTSPATRQVWQAIAQRGQGQYFSIAQDGGVQTIATPYDEQLGQLSSKLGASYVAYGGGAGEAGEVFRDGAAKRAAIAETRVATAAPSAAKAERALNKAVNAEAYVGDLLQNIENGSVKLDSLKEEDLPADLRKLSQEERKQEIDKRLTERRELRSQIVSLSKQRAEFIAGERKKKGAKDSGFDAAVSAALKEQLKRKGTK